MPAALDLTPWGGNCTSCRAAVVWAVSDAGRAMPVNPKPSDVGNVTLAVHRDRLVGGVLSHSKAVAARAHGVPLHTSHFVDCPDADNHRRRNRR